jgi:hypothetical protein
VGEEEERLPPAAHRKFFSNTINTELRRIACTKRRTNRAMRDCQVESWPGTPAWAARPCATRHKAMKASSTGLTQMASGLRSWPLP